MRLVISHVPKGIKTEAELDFLTAVERGEEVTQQKLGHDIGVSVGLINALAKRAIKKGLVKARHTSYKRYAYYLTPQGFSEKGRLVVRYLETSLHFFRQARDEYAEFLGRARDLGMTRVVLVGGGELAEIAVLAAVGEEFPLTAIIDPGANVAKRYGVPVVPAIEAAGEIDAAIVTDSCSPQETYEELRKLLPASAIFAPKLLRITPDRGDLLAATA
jgi:DNA-binding MarR family transcriptional regulator